MSVLAALVTTFVQVPLSKTLSLAASLEPLGGQTAEDCGCSKLLPGVNVCYCTMNVKQGMAKEKKKKEEEQVCPAEFLMIKQVGKTECVLEI